MSFDIDQAIEAANQIVADLQGRALSDVEVLVLKGAWERYSYDQIAARGQYSVSYISQDIAPKLWNILSDALGQKIKKNSFKEPLKRYWEANKPHAEPRLKFQGLASGTSISKTQNSHTQVSQPEAKLPYPSYIERPEIEESCFETLLHPGTLVRVKAPKLTGKTSLSNFVLSKLKSQGFHTIYLSLRMADRQRHFKDIDIFLKWLCCNIEQELDLESQISKYWNAEWLGSKVSCTTYFEKYFLAQDDDPMVLFIDDIDILFSYPDIYEDFFGLLRSWYEKARSRPQWKKLRLLLAHSTEVYIRLNINQSPFNVGLPVVLPELTALQVQQLGQRFGLEFSSEDIDQIIVLLGGHPYLCEKAFQHLQANAALSLEDFLVSAPTQAGIYRNHLQDIWQHLKAHPELEPAFCKVIEADQPISIEPNLAYQLQSIGLISLVGNLAQTTCQLYPKYFRANLKNTGSAPGQVI